MRLAIKTFLVLSTSILFFGFNYSVDSDQSDEIIDYCLVDQAREQSYKQLKPYRYSGFKYKSFKAKDYNQVKETIVELLAEIPYKLIFNRKGLPTGQSVNIVVYDRPYGKKNREELFRDSSDNEEVVFETSSLNDYYKRLYVEYELPAIEAELAENVTVKGCMTLTIGYNPLQFEQDKE